MDEAKQLLRRFALALCVWREARGEPLAGMVLVAQTIENRVVDKRWPDTYIGVITQPLQFSAFNRSDPNSVKFPTDDDPAWPRCVLAADQVLATGVPFSLANHYHTKEIFPPWADRSKIVDRVGNHIFYKL